MTTRVKRNMAAVAAAPPTRQPKLRFLSTDVHAQEVARAGGARWLMLSVAVEEAGQGRADGQGELLKVVLGLVAMTSVTHGDCSGSVCEGSGTLAR